jgi:adenosylhomocysteine nucleosidase
VLAIVSATPDEVAAVVQSLTQVNIDVAGRRHYHLGSLHGVSVVAVFSRWGKVAAAATATQLITRYGVSRLLFSGVAGAVQPDLAIGDIVIGTDLVQHDMDATPLFPRYEVPLLGKRAFPTDARLREQLMSAARDFLKHDLALQVGVAERAHFAIESPKVVPGTIASGDKFFANAAEIRALRERLPEVSCVEMEGAAVAQVCEEYGVPFGIVRTISDVADESAVHDFPRFSREVARHYCHGVIARFLERS